MDNQDRLASLGYLLHWAARLSARLIDREIAVLGVSPGQLTVFFALGDGRSMTTTALARAAGIEQPTMTRTLARMEKLGLVSRSRHETDARSALFTLTEEALRKAVTVDEAVRRTNASILDGLEAGDRDAFLEQLRTTVLHMDELASQGEDDAAR